MASKGKKTPARPMAEIVDEGMDVETTAAPVDPDDASDLISNVGGDLDASDIAAPANSQLAGEVAAQLAALQAESAKRDDSRDGAIANAIALLAGAIERMAGGQLQGARIIAEGNKKSQRPFNEVPPMISVFNLRGEKDFPKPKLKCRMLLPWEADEDASDREEVELLNLLQAGEYIVHRNDRTKIKITVRITTKLDSDEPSILVINHDTAFNNDYHRMLPPLTDMLRQMLRQNPKTKQAANEVLTMDEEAALILAGKLNDGTVPEDGKLISVGE